MKKYQPQEIEQSWYQKWEENDYFSPRDAETDSGSTPFCIMIPPPNVTGIVAQPVSVTRKMAASLPGLRELAVSKGLKMHHLARVIRIQR